MNDTRHADLNVQKLHSALSVHKETSQRQFEKKHPHAVSYLHEKGLTVGKLRHHAAKLLTSGVVAGTMFLASPTIAHNPQHVNPKIAVLTTPDRQRQFDKELKRILPFTMQPLETSQENQISNLLYDYWGLNAKAVLQGERLNRSYGFIGAEQHLPRYPGDTAEDHGAFIDKGVTPGRGAWGYFANSKESLTEDLIEKEKWYVAVQTLYLSDWNTRLRYLRDWYKYRKVVVVNPANGKLVVCDVADAGPSDWTGKHYGGSPEVMAYLNLNTGMQKGPVVLFFLDDPDNAIPLGPVEKSYSTLNALVER